MFDKDYKSAMDDINPEVQTKEKILEKIILKEELKERKNPAIMWRVAFACVMCVAIVLGVLFVPKDGMFYKNVTDKKPSSATSNSSGVLMVSKSYDEIYKLLKPKKVVLGDEDYIMYEYNDMEYIEGDAAAKPGSTTSTNQSTQDDGAIKNETVNDKDADKGEDFSNTTEQVEGVAEADIVKTDGKYIYYLLGNDLYVYKADGEKSSLVSHTLLERNQNENYGDMFLKDDRLIIMQSDDFINDCSYVSVIIYDVSNPKSPKQIAKTSQEGRYNSSRMVGDYMYLISNCYINTAAMDKDDPATFVPTVEINGVCKIVPADSIYCYAEESYDNRYTVIGAFNYKDGTMSDTASLLGGADNIYCSQGNIILADCRYKSDSDIEGSYSVNNTVVSRLEIKDGQIEYKASGEVEGLLNNQFFIDECGGYFRFVTTVTTATQTKQKFDNTASEIISYRSETSARLTILDAELKKVGEITDLAKGERVYSVRFMGDIAYFVTFRQTDPLFSADLSDPKNPKILGELKIPGFSEYMYPYGEGKLLGFGMDADTYTGRTTYLKLSMFDITNPSDVTEDNKIIINGYSWSQALENHKAMLVSPGKNLIGFPTYNPTYKATENSKYKYMIYEYSGDGFVQKAVISIPWNSKEDFYYDSIRGMFIKDNFYVISAQSLQVFDINTFSPIATVNF